MRVRRGGEGGGGSEEQEGEGGAAAAAEAAASPPRSSRISSAWPLALTTSQVLTCWLLLLLSRGCGGCCERGEEEEAEAEAEAEVPSAAVAATGAAAAAAAATAALRTRRFISTSAGALPGAPQASSLRSRLARASGSLTSSIRLAS